MATEGAVGRHSAKVGSSVGAQAAGCDQAGRAVTGVTGVSCRVTRGNIQPPLPWTSRGPHTGGPGLAVSRGRGVQGEPRGQRAAGQQALSRSEFRYGPELRRGVGEGEGRGSGDLAIGRHPREGRARRGRQGVGRDRGDQRAAAALPVPQRSARGPRPLHSGGHAVDGCLWTAVETRPLVQGHGGKVVVGVLVQVGGVAAVASGPPHGVQVRRDAAQRGARATAEEGHPGGAGEAGRLDAQQPAQPAQQRGGVAGLLVLLDLLQVGLELHVLLGHTVSETLS